MVSEDEIREFVSVLPQKVFGRMIDHTLLNPTATRKHMESFVAQAVNLGVNLCVNESRISDVLSQLKGLNADVTIACVIGFPFGATATDIKAYSAKHVLEAGADEVDMVINVGYLKDRDQRFREDLAAVAYMMHDMGRKMPWKHPVLKVIIETCYLSKDDIIYATKTITSLAKEFCIDMMVKTSTGYGNPPEGKVKGATVGDIKLIRSTIGDMFGKGIGIKASGGIRTLADAITMIKAAGVYSSGNITISHERLPYTFRIGTSAGDKIMHEFITVKETI